MHAVGRSVTADGMADSILQTAARCDDARAVRIEEGSLVTGALHVTSFARPGKLFTASHNLIAAEIATLTPASLHQLIDAVVDLLRTGR